MSSAIIEVTDIKKSFLVGEQTVEILHGITAHIDMGDFVIIVGPSGCGKSTLLHIILGLEKPSEGDVVFLGERIYDGTTEDYRSDFRKKHIGMVYQQPNWVKSMTVSENVAFPMLLLGMEREAARERSLTLLEKLKMKEWADYMPTELSGGQQQRVSLARALSNNPEIIIADEPTGNLDFQTGQEVMQMLQDLNHQEQKTIIMVTHDLEYLKYASSAIKMFDGHIDAIYNGKQIEELLSTSQQKRGVGSAIKIDQQTQPNSGRATTPAKVVVSPTPQPTSSVPTSEAPANKVDPSTSVAPSQPESSTIVDNKKPAPLSTSATEISPEPESASPTPAVPASTETDSQLPVTGPITTIEHLDDPVPTIIPRVVKVRRKRKLSNP